MNWVVRGIDYILSVRLTYTKVTTFRLHTFKSVPWGSRNGSGALRCCNSGCSGPEGSLRLAIASARAMGSVCRDIEGRSEMMCLRKKGIGGRWRNRVSKECALLVSMLCLRVRVERIFIFR